MAFDDLSGVFLSSRPEWSLSGAKIPCGNGRLTLQQTPFRMVGGLWETEAIVKELAPNGSPTRVVLRVTPETLRRWKDVGINPLVEACAQLEEYLRHVARHGHLTALTLL